MYRYRYTYVHAHTKIHISFKSIKKIGHRKISKKFEKTLHTKRILK